MIYLAPDPGHDSCHRSHRRGGLWDGNASLSRECLLDGTDRGDVSLKPAHNKGGREMRRHSDLSFVLLLLAMILVVALSGGSGPVGIADAQTAGAVPRTVTVLVGGGQETIVLDGFFPQNLRIRVGDTVAWKFNEIGRASCRERV